MTAFLLALCLAAAAQDPTPPVSSGATQNGEDPPPESAGDLLRIARLEASRSMLRMQAVLDRELASIAALGDPRDARLEPVLTRLADLGPDAVPLLVEAVEAPTRGGDRHRPLHAVQVLVLLFQNNSDRIILAELERLSQVESQALRLALLTGLLQLQHPQVVHLITPLLEDRSSEVVDLALRVLARQETEAVAGLIRPFLAPHLAPAPDADPEAEPVANPHRATAVAALRERGDTTSAPAVAELLLAAGDEEDDLRAAALSFLAALGNRDSLAPLREFAFETADVPSRTRRAALAAAQQIGLRHKNAASPARDILQEGFKSANPTLKESCAWLLGPFEDETALDWYEGRHDADIKRTNRKDPDAFIDQAQTRLQFRQWKDALKSLRLAELADESRAYLQQIYILKAVAYAEQDKYKEAKEALLKSGRRNLFTLLPDWECFRRMSHDERYGDVFRAR